MGGNVSNVSFRIDSDLMPREETVEAFWEARQLMDDKEAKTYVVEEALEELKA